MTSNERIIFILFKLIHGDRLNLIEESEIYGVNIRTIQRDFSTINKIAPEFGFKLNYQEDEKRYSLENPKRLSFNDSLAVIKVLLASRAFNFSEINSLLKKIINLNIRADADLINKSIQNEITFYQPLEHNRSLLTDIRLISNYIEEKRIISIQYKKNTGQITKRNVLPVSIFFSEYYFYAICYEIDKDRYINLRIDRFISYKDTHKTFLIPHKSRLEEKDLREKMILMQYGLKKRFRFKFSGIVEAALDKFPNGQVIKTFDDGSVLIEAEAYDRGIIMWILSQGHLAKIISPQSLVNDIKIEIQQMNDLYK